VRILDTNPVSPRSRFCLPPSQYEAAFLGAAHTEEDVQQTITAAKLAFGAVKG